MIILDTSIWIEFLRKNPIFFYKIKSLIETNKVVASSVVFAELLQGAKSKRELNIIKQYWHNLPKIDEQDVNIFAGELSYRDKLHDKGVGIIDCIIISSAILNKVKVLTLDKKLLNVLPSEVIFVL